LEIFTFLSRDAMHSVDYAVARWLSVCLFARLSVLPSVTRRYSVKTAQNVIKLFSRPSSHVILVFAVLLNVMAVFRPGFLTGASNARGMKKSRFSTSISQHLRNDTSYDHVECE